MPARALARLARLEALVEALASTAPPPSALELMPLSGLAPDPWQRQVLSSPAERRLLLCCRQSGKTQVAAATALATALHEPGALVLVLSPSLRQSQESFRRVLALYRALRRPMPTEAESALRLELANGSRILSLPGTESTIRGYSRVRLLVIDEAARVSDELYYAVRPMLAVSQGRLLVLSTPFGRRSWFYTEYTEGEGWERTRITAEQCPRISPQFLAEERRSLPRIWFQSEYLCEFTETADSVFSYDDVMACLDPEVKPLWERV